MSEPFPITRFNADQREIEITASFETIDPDNTILSYKASKKAFQNWIERSGIVVEMYDHHHAVGKGTRILFDDTVNQAVIVVRISNGAPDTYAQVFGNALTGVGMTITDLKWDVLDHNGKMHPYLVEYKLKSLSLVGPIQTLVIG